MPLIIIKHLNWFLMSCFIKETSKSIGVLIQKNTYYVEKKVLHIVEYVKLPIDAYQVYIIFECPE